MPEHALCTCLKWGHVISVISLAYLKWLEGEPRYIGNDGDNGTCFSCFLTTLQVTHDAQKNYKSDCKATFQHSRHSILRIIPSTACLSFTSVHEQREREALSACPHTDETRVAVGSNVIGIKNGINRRPPRRNGSLWIWDSSGSCPPSPIDRIQGC